MSDLAAVWSELLPEIKRNVTGVGVWTALNACRPVIVEDGTVILGLPSGETELAGHLRLAQTRRAIEDALTKGLGQSVTLRVIDGTSEQDWEIEKKRDAEKRRLQEVALARHRAELAAGVSWEGVYEQISRKFAATPNRSLPQNRAKFFLEAVDIIVEALLEAPITDEMAERNYARCLERVAQYTELPSVLVALKVLEKSFSG